MTTARIRGKAEPLLNDFAVYCINHPELRFWQALKNWSGYKKIIAVEKNILVSMEGYDTYNWEGKRHDEESKSSS